MNEDELRALLADVQAGRLSPDDAAGRLSADAPEATGHAGDDVPDDAIDPDGSAVPHDVAGITSVQIRATAAGVRVVGRPGLHEMRVTGEHTLERSPDGTEVTVLVGTGAGEGGFSFEHRSFSFGPMQWRNIRRGAEDVVVELNPDLDVDFTCDAGSISLSGIRGALTGQSNAARCVITDGQGPLNLSVNAGSLDVQAVFAEGESSIDCNAGRAVVVLLPGSDVRVVTETNLGSAHVPVEVVGAGTATLDVTCNLGAVRVHPGSAAEADAAWDDRRSAARDAMRDARSAARQARFDAKGAQFEAKRAARAARDRVRSGEGFGVAWHDVRESLGPEIDVLRQQVGDLSRKLADLIANPPAPPVPPTPPTPPVPPVPPVPPTPPVASDAVEVDTVTMTFIDETPDEGAA